MQFGPVARSLDWRDDLDVEPPDSLDFCFDPVPWIQKLADRGTRPGWRAGEDDVTRLQGDIAADRTELLRYRIQHIRRAAVLLDLPIDEQFQTQILHVPDESRGSDEGSHGSHAVLCLGAHQIDPGRGVPLQ